VNRISRLTEIHPPLIARIVGTPVAGTTIPAGYRELQTAVDAGRIQDLDAKSSVKQALWSFAGELGLSTAAEASRGSGKHIKSGGRGARAAKGQAGSPKQVLPPDSSTGSDGRALPPGGAPEAASGGTAQGGAAGAQN